MTGTSLYTDGTYLEHTAGTWHAEDAPFKARQVLKMLKRHGLRPRTVCDVGCGAGALLAELRSALDADASLCGYEISPQAYELCLRHRHSNLRFVLGDAFTDGQTYELVLVMDVIEHVEDMFGFLRRCREKGEFKIFHIPLEVSIQSVLRDRIPVDKWRISGHIHLFTIGTALEALRHTGYEVIDHFLTAGALETARGFAYLNVCRRVVGAFSASLSSQMWGGYSLLVLAK